MTALRRVLAGICLGIGLGFVLAGPAAAQDRPPLTPTRDVMVEYLAGGQASAAKSGDADRGSVRVRVRFGGGMLRVEPASLAGYVLVDPRAGRALVVLEKQRIVMEVPDWFSLGPGALLGDQVRFTRRGADLVAGLSCTVWDVQAPEGRSGQICETSDGVVLRAAGTDPRFGRGHLEAIRVTYAPQPAKLFQPPIGYKTVDLLHMLPGLSGAGPRPR